LPLPHAATTIARTRAAIGHIRDQTRSHEATSLSILRPSERRSIVSVPTIDISGCAAYRDEYRSDHDEPPFVGARGSRFGTTTAHLRIPSLRGTHVARGDGHRGAGRAPVDGFARLKAMEHSSTSANRLALSATVHCLTGCAIGEVLGLVIATALGWHDLPSVILAIVLAFVFGYGLTIRPLVSSGIPLRQAGRLAFASDTLSIVTMEVVDTVIVLAIPGAMAAGLVDPLFWGSLAVALVVAGAVAYPVNRWLIARGKGHALVHEAHGGMTR